MKNRFLCLGIRRAGITTIAYVENGQVVVKTIPSLPKPSPRPLLKGAERHG